MSRPAIPRQPAPHGSFNDHRNTSRVWPVPPDALPAALKALRGLAPELRAWITAGHPTMTEAEHRERFGEDYTADRPRKQTNRGNAPHEQRS